MITFKNLTLKNFKNHEELKIDFGAHTEIKGSNGKGKTSIGESITWLFYGINLVGDKIDPTPLSGGDVEVSLFLNDGEKDILFERKLIKGKANYFVNETPEKATQFNEYVVALFEEKHFMSVFSPGYFFTQHWKQQREQLLRFVVEPSNKEVLEKLGNNEKKALEEPLKSKSIEDLEKIHRPKTKELNTEVERAGERVVTLKEQLENAIDCSDEEFEALKEELQKKHDELQELQTKRNDIKREQDAYYAQRSKVDQYKQKVNELSDKVKAKQAEAIGEHCDSCGQPLQGEALETAKANHQKQLNDLKRQGQSVHKQYKEEKEKFDSMSNPDGKTVDTGALYEEFMTMKEKFQKIQNDKGLQEKLQEASDNKERLRKELLTSRAIIDATNTYHNEKSKIMAKKVNSLLDSLSVKLFDEKKNGAITPTFEVEMDNKPYNKLSTAEKIKAGLELGQALIGLSDQSVPVFVDNAESILNFKAPDAQLIVSKVRQGNMKIEIKEEFGNE